MASYSTPKNRPTFFYLQSPQTNTELTTIMRNSLSVTSTHCIIAHNTSANASNTRMFLSLGINHCTSAILIYSSLGTKNSYMKLLLTVTA